MSFKPYDIDCEPESDELLAIAEKELRETPELREKSISELRDLLHAATDLHYADDDDFLLIFLRPCHFYVDSALKLMRRIAEFRKENFKLIGSISPDEDKEAFIEGNVVNVLTNKDQNGRRVLMVNCGGLWDTKKVTSDQLFRLFYMIHLIAQLEKSSQINGVVVIMDFEGLSMKQIKALSPSFSKRLLTFIQEAMPLRMKEVHFVKQPFIFNMVWNLFKPFVQAKLKKRMYFHGDDMKKLHKHMDPSCLPENYGGTLPKIDYTAKDWYPCVDNYREHIQNWGSYGFANQS
ncbi:unnamed protein product [Diamesa serratosioi]